MLNNETEISKFLGGNLIFKRLVDKISLGSPAKGTSKQAYYWSFNCFCT